MTYSTGLQYSLLTVLNSPKESSNLLLEMLEYQPNNTNQSNILLDKVREYTKYLLQRSPLMCALLRRRWR